MTLQTLWQAEKSIYPLHALRYNSSWQVDDRATADSFPETYSGYWPCPSAVSTAWADAVKEFLRCFLSSGKKGFRYIVSKNRANFLGFKIYLFIVFIYLTKKYKIGSAIAPNDQDIN